LPVDGIFYGVTYWYAATNNALAWALLVNDVHQRVLCYVNALKSQIAFGYRGPVTNFYAYTIIERAPKRGAGLAGTKARPAPTLPLQALRR